MTRKTTPLLAALILAMTRIAEPQSTTSTAPDFETRVVEDSSGNPLPSAEIRFHNGMRELAADLETDRNGRARAGGLEPGEYSIEVVKPNFVTASFKVHLPAPAMTVRLVRYGVITGQITDHTGQPAPAAIHAPYGKVIGGTRVAILGPDAAGKLQLLREIAPEPDGRYRVYDLTPGQYAIGIWYDGLPNGSGFQLHPDTAHPGIFSISGGEEYDHVDFLIAPQPVFSISGKVEVPNAKAQFNLALSLPDQPIMPIALTLSEPGGAFKFDRIPAGTYDLLTGGPSGGYTAHETVLGANPLYARQRISVGQNMEGVAVQPAPGRSLTVTVNAPSICPRSVSVALEAVDAWGLRFSNLNTTVALKQEAEIKNVPPGRFRVVATQLPSDCFQPHPPIADVSAASGPVAIELAAAGSIRGVLRGAATPGDYTVLLLDANAAKFTHPDLQGKFQFDSLPPGRYRIAAQTGNARTVADVTKMVEIEVGAGSPTEVDLPVPQRGVK